VEEGERDEETLMDVQRASRGRARAGAGLAGAGHIDRRGSFNDGFGGSINLIYDDDLNIIWLGDANFAQTSGFNTDGLMTGRTRSIGPIA